MKSNNTLDLTFPAWAFSLESPGWLDLFVSILVEQFDLTHDYYTAHT